MCSSRKHWENLSKSNECAQTENNPYNLGTNAGLSPSDPWALMPLHTFSYVSSHTQSHCNFPSLTPLYSSKHTISLSSAGEGWQHLRTGTNDKSRRFYWSVFILLSNSGQKTTLSDLAPQQQTWSSLKWACNGQAVTQTAIRRPKQPKCHLGWCSTSLSYQNETLHNIIWGEISSEQVSNYFPAKHWGNTCPDQRIFSQTKCHCMVGNSTLKCKTEWSMQQRATACSSRLLNDTCQNRREFQIPHGHRHTYRQHSCIRQ